MARLIALDYGARRTGIAVTDPLQIIATALQTVQTAELIDFLKAFISREPVEALIVGQPFRRSGEASEIETEILDFIQKFKDTFPELPVYRQEEQFSSKRAMESLISSGVPKNKRRQKGILDSTAATLILQDFMEERR